MKIAIDISQIVYGTGVSIYTENLVKYLTKIDKKNEYLLFGTSLRSYSKLIKLKKELAGRSNVTFKFYPFPIRIFELLFNRFRFLKIDKLIGNVDVLHTSDWIEPKVTSSIKKVTTIHDMVPYLFPATLNKRILSNQRRRLSLVKKETDIAIAPSSATKEDAVKFLEIPQEKIAVIPEAPDPIFKPQTEERIDEVLKKFKIKKPYLLSVSTQEPRKNIHTLIDAFENITKQWQGLMLVLVGKKGWGQALDIVPNAVQTGYVKKDELIALYAGCKIFIYPSLYEGFGLPILEAMATGAPTITSNTSAMAEIASDAGILINPRSEGQLKKAIELILNLDVDNYQKMVRASLDRARQFTWTKNAKETLKIYEKFREN